MLTIAYNGGGWLQDCVRMQKKKKFEPQNLFFCTKEVTTLLCNIVYRKV